VEGKIGTETQEIFYFVKNCVDRFLEKLAKILPEGLAIFS
jgi:hypothetical protein